MSTIPIGVHALMAQRATADLPGVAARIVSGLGQIPYTREEFAWSQIQPEPGPYNWQATDAWVAQCAMAGLHVFAILNKPPQWVTGAKTLGESWTIPPLSDKARSGYAQFCGDTAARYGPEGTFWKANSTLPYVPITEFEIWNEPYKAGAWKGPFGEQIPSDPSEYASMFLAAASAIHATLGCKAFAAVDTGTDNTGTLPVPQPYLSLFLSAPGVLGSVDGLSVHAYGFNHSPATYITTGTPRAPFDLEWRGSWKHTSKVGDVRRLLVDCGVPTLPVWITEIGYPTNTIGPGYVLGDSTQAAEQQQAMRIEAVFNYLKANCGLVQGLIFYTWQTMAWQADVVNSPNYNASDPEHFFGLVHNDGTNGYGDGTTCTAKPAWLTLQMLSKNGIPY